MAVAVAVALGVLWFAGWRDRVAQRRLGQAEERVARLVRDSVDAAGAIRRTDSVFSRDTLTLTRVVRSQQTIRDTLLTRLTDTVLVERFIAASDSTVRACRAAVESCSQRVAARDSLIAVLGQQRDADRRLFDARLRASRPLLTPYVEAGADPLHAWALTGRAGLEMRVLGPLRLTGALQYTAGQPHPTRALLGARFTF